MSSSSSNLHTSSAVMSLEDYYDSIWIPTEEIESATNNFADENLMKQTPSSKIYKGRLIQSGEFINIVARICMQPETEFNEMNLHKDLRHKHIVPLFKISQTIDYTNVMIYKHEANESLDKHLSTSLSWMQRLNICVGIARALKYLHYDAEENHSVIHGNIKSSKILLDHNWEPKLHGCGSAVKAKRNQIYLTDKYNGSLQYMDPAYETTKALTNKSDVFSFGVVLFEVLFGMEASSVPVPAHDHNDNLYFTRMARVHYEDNTLDDMIHPDLREQMNLELLNIFSETAYCCLKEERSQRPDIKKVLQRLERALELQYKHDQALELSEGASSSSHPKVKILDHLRLRLSDIKSATNDFSDKYRIGSGGFGTVYKAELDHFDGGSSPVLSVGEKKVELHKKRSTVAVKRISSSRVDGQPEQGFLAEIELVSKCKHPNIISLIGFCDEEQEMILIYEYASNGSLEDYLGNNDKLTNLTWDQRIKICIDIAYGLEYLHKVIEGKECIIHRDIKSANVLLDDEWNAKIADFGLSKLHRTYEQRSTFFSGNIGGTEVYIDPEYLETGKLKIQSDIYSFGVVLFEMMSGNLAYDKVYDSMALPSIARQCVNDGTIENLVDPRLKEHEIMYALNDGFNRDSLYTFSKIASECVAKAQSNRPTMKVIITELEKSLDLENNRKDNLHMSLEAIKLGTQDFINDCNCTREGRFWRLYEGEISPAANANRNTPIVIKRFDRLSDKGNSQFVTELKALFDGKHKNIVGLVGYCIEMGEKIIVYEHASNGTLNKHLENANLTWTNRLKIGLDVARGLEYLHTGGIMKDNLMIHRDIKSSSILLDGDWRAKISNLEESSREYERKKIEHIDDDNAFGSLSYIDPDYKENGYLGKWSDMYSLGVVLLEMMLGRLAWAEECEGHSESFVSLAKKWYEEEDTLHESIFEGIKKQIVSRSLDAYSEITFECLQRSFYNRPYATSRVVEQLTLSLAYQEDYEMWQPRLPKDYEKLCEMSDAFCLYNANIYRMSDCNQGYYKNIPGRIKDFYDALYNGYLFQEGKGWFSLGSNGKRNVMISATQFSYTNRWQRKWRSFPKSRFQVVAQMLDILNLKIRIKIKPQVLLSGDSYRVHLVFKFSEPRKCLAKQRYVNLKYKRGNDNLQTDFATWREDGWMMIELGQILNYEDDTEFEVLLESFSRSYYGSRNVYIQGIEFRTIDNEYEDGSKEIEKYEDIQKLKEDQQVLKSYSNIDKEFLLKQVQKENIYFILSERKVPFDYSKRKDSWSRAESTFASIAKPFHLKYSAESRFQGEIELLKQQVFGIKDKIESQMLSPDTDYMCYLVFKLSENCRGLHCPVRVRHGLKRENKEIGLICFKPPTRWNLPDSNGAPKERADGWMEVLVWKFNSNSELKNDHIHMNLKFITYEGTMSGLILRGLEIRPI